jgi:hippurate hydrolase
MTSATTTDDWAALYRDLHAHPELSFQEHRTAGIVAERLAASGYEVRTGVGRTGVVGVLANGPGPVVALRADMDALPLLEKTGLAYASTDRGTDPDGKDVPVMHGCGHDVHVTCLLAACTELAATRSAWSGTIVAVFQPAEELGIGAKTMVADGLWEHAPRPIVVLGQHVGNMPAGVIGLHPGPAYAALDTLRITLHGKGGHASAPDTSVDPVVMAAATVLRLQTVVAREVPGVEFAVVTVGRLHAGTKANIIPDDAELLLSIRSYLPHVRDRVLAAIERIARGEAAASGAPREPTIERMETVAATVNDPDACTRTMPALEASCGRVVDPGPIPGSEDVGELAVAAGCPLVYWTLGGADRAPFGDVLETGDVTAIKRVAATLPSNHSPMMAPVIEPTLSVGISALVNAARAWLAVPQGTADV